MWTNSVVLTVPDILKKSNQARQQNLNTEKLLIDRQRETKHRAQRSWEKKQAVMWDTESLWQTSVAQKKQEHLNGKGAAVYISLLRGICAAQSAAVAALINAK